MKHRTPLLEKIWLLAPAAIWFSYRPLFGIGQDATMNIELSITLLYLAILAAASLQSIRQSWRELSRRHSVRLVTAFMAISGLSIMWSANTRRGVLTFGVMTLLYLVFLGVIAQQNCLRKVLPLLVRGLIISAMLMSILSFVQFIAAIWLDPKTILLCGGCSPSQFGFARPNVFTIEPQFFGNMLLAPAIILLHKIFSGKYRRAELLGFLVIVTALFLTLSRGSIFALGVAILILLVVHRPLLKQLLIPASALLGSFTICLLMQGVGAVLSPSINTSFTKGVTASINQLTLGIVDLQRETKPAVETPIPSGQVLPVADEPIVDSRPVETQPNFDGYVAESTNVRLKLSKLALRSWSKTPSRILFGVGLGGSGVVLRNDFPDQVNTREIVQNQFTETLLEGGLVGMTLFLSIVAGLLYVLRNNKWSWAIVAAFLVQWSFFSGYPNAIHLYLTLIILVVYGWSSDRSRKAKA